MPGLAGCDEGENAWTEDKQAKIECNRSVRRSAKSCSLDTLADVEA